MNLLKIAKVGVVLSLLLCYSCGTNTTKHQDDALISQVLDCQHEDKCYALVIPMDGCGGCRSIAIQFLKDSVYQKPAMHYVASTRHAKTAKIKLGDAFADQQVVMDTKEVFYQEESSEKYPLLYQLENGNVLGKKELGPSTIQKELYSIK